MAVDLERYLEGCRARRGDPFVVELPSLGAILVTGHPEGARAIFSAPMDVFEPVSPNPVEPLLGQHSLLLLAGEKHRRERRLMTPPFHGERMRAYGTIIRDTALAELATWRPSDSVSLQDAMRRITLHVIMRAVLGVEGQDKTARFTTAISTMLSAYTPALLILPFLRRGLHGLGPWIRLVAAREAVRALFRQEIAARRRPARRDVRTSSAYSWTLVMKTARRSARTSSSTNCARSSWVGTIRRRLRWRGRCSTCIVRQRCSRR